MSEFIKFDKIYSLGKREVMGILDCPVTVQEKLDGANASCWLKVDGTLGFGSRNQEVETFRGFPEYIKQHKGINKLLEDHPDYNLFGEWLVKHTVQYKPEALNHFYLFDICDQAGLLYAAEVERIANLYGIKTPEVFVRDSITTSEELQQLVGRSKLTIKDNAGEGIVIKANTFEAAAKLVGSSFKEEAKAPSEVSGCEYEMCHRFVTGARVEKIMHKLIDQLNGAVVGMEQTGRIITMIYEDVLAEEVLYIAKHSKCPFDFKLFHKCVANTTRRMYHDLLEC
jgi:hypothetical protein